MPILFWDLRLSRNLLHYKCLESIALSDVVELLDADTALVALGYLLNVVLEATERGDLILEDNYTVTNDTDLRLTGDLTVLDIASCDNADTGYANGLSDLRMAKENLLVRGSEQTLHSRLYLIDDLIDDTVSTDIYVVSLCGVQRVLIGTYVEAYDDGIGCRRKLRLHRRRA